MSFKRNKTLLCLYKFMVIFFVIQCSNEFNLKVKQDTIINPLRKLQSDPVISNSTLPLPGNATIDINRKSSSGGLSTGGIIAIIIPCIAALIAVSVLAALCRTIAVPKPDLIYQPPYMDTSLEKFTSPNQIVVQQPQVKEVGEVHEEHEVQELPVVKQVPVVQQVPIVQHVPVVQQIPVVEHVPVVQQVPVVQHVPVVQQVPVAQEVVAHPVQVVHDSDVVV